jgi:hypothetical protein
MRTDEPTGKTGLKHPNDAEGDTERSIDKTWAKERGAARAAWRPSVLLESLLSGVHVRDLRLTESCP